MSSGLEFTRATPEDLPQLAENTAWAFGGPGIDMLPWLERMGHDNMRVLRKGGRPVAQLGLVWMGTYFGGRSIPLAGVVAVAVNPHERGHGAATRLMTDSLREARDAGYPLSGLYPATQPIYRSVGYERAGVRYEVRLASSLIDLKDRELALEPITEADHAAVAAVYAEKARQNPGHLDRGEYIWNRVWKPRGDAPRGYKVMNGDRMEGYVVLAKMAAQTLYADFQALDLAALTPAAGRRILTLFADHKSLANDFLWFGAPNDPLLMQLREQEAKVKTLFTWMLRILDLPAALGRRGYPPGLSAELHLRVTDDLFPENAGDWTLTVANGEGVATRGGRGTFRTSIRGLAPLYSGFLTPATLQAAGFVDAPAADLRTAEAIFAGPPPWMPDMY